jgi:hypothetical protein
VCYAVPVLRSTPASERLTSWSPKGRFKKLLNLIYCFTAYYANKNIIYYMFLFR